MHTYLYYKMKSFIVLLLLFFVINSMKVNIHSNVLILSHNDDAGDACK
jgi:hypothetical protein